MMSPEQFQARILSWFDQCGRKDLPWQHQITPYRVWVSEIMLQQTQVATVIPYFQRFIAQFPDIQALAAASLDCVLSHWAGLGYYARARNLHKSAQLIAAAEGEFPSHLEDVMALPGIGRSTAGAILSIAGGQSHPILDGNVKRVLARFHGVFGWPGNAGVAKELWTISARYTPQQKAAEYTQAMMDLGATLCARSKPSCSVCPISTACYAYNERKTAELPGAKPKKKLPVKESIMLFLADKEGNILLERRPPTGIWGGLWCLPEFDDRAEMEQWLGKWGSAQFTGKVLLPRRHTFSHYHLDYSVACACSENRTNYVMEANDTVWYKASQIKTLGLPAPIKRVLQEQIKEENNGKNG
jgi:A/G-specific adenine glycosylase